MSEWFEEAAEGGVGTRLAVERMLFDRRSPFQRIQIFDNRLFGRVLALDGAIQITSADDDAYHEVLAHVPMLAHADVREALIVGGGDGGLLEEILKHPGVRRVVVVEIDAAVIDAARRYLPMICGTAFEDPRVEIVIGDGAAYVAETARRFDLLAVDSSSAEGPGAALFGAAFYAHCRRCLKPGGILVSQNDRPFLYPRALARDARRLARVFADVAFFKTAVASYLGGDELFGWASDEPGLRRQSAAVLARRFRAARLKTRYYSPALHRAAFVLPAATGALIARALAPACVKQNP